MHNRPLKILFADNKFTGVKNNIFQLSTLIQIIETTKNMTEITGKLIF